MNSNNRAEKLSQDQRTEIARRGVLAHWQRFDVPEGTVIPKAIVSGVLPLGNIPRAVLDDKENTRVLSQAGFLQAIGRTRTPTSSSANEAVANLPVFLLGRISDCEIARESAETSVHLSYPPA
jgi:hypothetical protein